MDTPNPPTKYRASCDGCYLAKLKCTKEKPVCPRCKNLGLSCTYSPSQRTGKHRANKSHARSSASTTATTPSTSTAPSPSQASDWQPTASSRVSTIIPNETLAHSFENSSFAQNNNTSQSLMDTTMSDWPSSATTLHDLDSNLLAPWRSYLPNSDKDESLFPISDDFAGGFTGMTPPATEQPSLNTTNDAYSRNLHTCNCFNSITQSLHEMHNQPRRSGHPALEATLSCSKEVTARGEMLLNCTCTEDSTLIMLFAALIAKYLSLYATNVEPTSSPPRDIRSSSPRVTIGKYTMDVEDGERLRTEIILMELQKLNALLMKFRSKFSAVDVTYEGHMYETMLDFLSTRLKEAMKKLQRQKQRYQTP